MTVGLRGWSGGSVRGLPGLGPGSPPIYCWNLVCVLLQWMCHIIWMMSLLGAFKGASMGASMEASLGASSRPLILDDVIPLRAMDVYSENHSSLFGFVRDIHRRYGMRPRDFASQPSAGPGRSRRLRTANGRVSFGRSSVRSATLVFSLRGKVLTYGRWRARMVWRVAFKIDCVSSCRQTVAFPGVRFFFLPGG